MRPSAHRLLVAATLAVLAVVVTACSPGNPDVDSLAATQGLPNLKVDLAADGWLLDPTGTTVGLGAEPISLDFHTDGTASGAAPCNTYRASVTYGNGTVTISDVKTTLRACEPAVMANETAYFAALTAVRDVDLTNRDRLLLTAPGGVRLAFNSFNPYDAIAKTWHVVNLATPQGLVSVPGDTKPTITFTDDHKITVALGADCTSTAGTWSLDDDNLTVTDLAAPTGCPPESAATAGAVTTALTGTHSVQLNPPKLMLLTPADTIALVATAEA